MEQKVENPQGIADTFKKQNILLTQQMFHTATPQHGNKNRGVGITRKDKTISKKKLAISKKSVKLNRNKKRHHMTRREKKSR